MLMIIAMVFLLSVWTMINPSYRRMECTAIFAVTGFCLLRYGIKDNPEEQ
jgi:hypothetical protein